MRAEVGDRAERDDPPRVGRAPARHAGDHAVAARDLDQRAARGLRHVGVVGLLRRSARARRPRRAGPRSGPARRAAAAAIPRSSAGTGLVCRAVDTEQGSGWAVGSIDGLGSGPGFRKIRGPLGVTAFGINAIVLPPAYATNPHHHETQEEVYIVHDGEIEITLGGEPRTLGPGGMARVDAATVRRCATPRTRPRRPMSASAGPAATSVATASRTPVAEPAGRGSPSAGGCPRRAPPAPAPRPACVAPPAALSGLTTKKKIDGRDRQEREHRVEEVAVEEHGAVDRERQAGEARLADDRRRSAA